VDKIIMPNKKKVKPIFLSSTTRDLIDYRGSACEVIEKLSDEYHCVRMENWGAIPETPESFCPEKVCECDLFVGIVGHCYGSCPPGKKMSYTEIEYDTAQAIGMDCLMFLVKDDYSYPTYKREPDAAWKKLQSFRKKIREIHGYFRTPDDLKLVLLQGIRNWEQRLSQVKKLPHLLSSIVELQMQAEGWKQLHKDSQDISHDLFLLLGSVLPKDLRTTLGDLEIRWYTIYNNITSFTKIGYLPSRIVKEEFMNSGWLSRLQLEANKIDIIISECVTEEDLLIKMEEFKTGLNRLGRIASEMLKSLDGKLQETMKELNTATRKLEQK